ncbi:MAG TPA: nuclear transport factor 2 family protein [Acidimicrobiales bacterium]|jgi:hypothetical protein|nr:nuclear transport factor 2 family protein [Acidimicrobiales bacterium]
MAERDWQAFAGKLEAALDMGTKGGFRELFAPGARFADPANAPTDDLRDIQQQTRAVMPDWRQEITSIRGGDGWAFFEWIGYATYHGRDKSAPGHGTPITMHGASIIEVDDNGLITSWRDYLDRKEPEDQIRAALRTQHS